MENYTGIGATGYISQELKSRLQVQGVIEYKAVKKGYEQTVYETGKFGTWLNFSKFTAPKDGYFIRIKNQVVFQKVC